MNLLFNYKFKKISGWVFYLSIPVSLYLLFTDRYDELLVTRVYSLFSFEKTIITEHTENIIGSNGLHWIKNGLLDEILTTLIIVSGLVNSFCKEIVEDELISKLRSDSLTLSIYLNYGILILANILIYELTFYYVLVFNLFMIILFFNLIFKFKLYQHYKS
jgi:hypothetical protein